MATSISLHGPTPHRVPLSLGTLLLQLSPGSETYSLPLYLCASAKSLLSRPVLCDPMDCHPPGSSVHRILQARILELPCPPPGDLPNPRTELASLTVRIGRRILYH